MKLGKLLLPIAFMASTAAANPGGEIGYPEGSLGYDALVKADYVGAERQILSESRVAKDDPARLINLAHIYLKTGRNDLAVQALEEAVDSEEVELILANGEIIGSRDAARKALDKIRK